MKDVIVYGKSRCPNCTNAVKLLESKNVPHQYVDLELDMTKFIELRSKGIRQVPVIEINGELKNYQELRMILS